jgi:hypothetical protein
MWKDGIDVGANYLNKWGDFSLALYGGFGYAWADKSGVLANAIQTAQSSVIRDFKAWAVGANFGFGGFTLGGGAGQDNNGFRGNKTTFYTVGIMYETGPWQASVGYWHGSRKEDNAVVIGGGGAIGTDKVNYITLGVNYAIGPGVKLVGGFVWDSRKGQNIAESADAWQFLLGTELRF